ncbi:hypothetical protein KR767_11905 [Luteibacter anthropi]|uniref:hypothetical protein n=1 Tax=Luteibacter anthropi TaxID=564369 RepID=UPI002032E967|nr:hypothetical protein [Luteibacter anthropi]URX60806.1 hypothetical protein KR767_11905 [Luteibacter anthropi]
MDLPVTAITGAGLGLLAVNVAVYLDRMHGVTHACRSAREFCVVSFGFALVAAVALLDLVTEVWIDPQESVALGVLMSAGIGLSLTTSAALGFCLVSRL